MANFSVLPHPADVGLLAWGGNLSAALDSSVRALAAISLGAAPPVGEGRRSVRLHALDEPSLVVALLEECLFLLDAEDWLATGALLKRNGEHIEGHLLGVDFDPALAANGVHVKAITWHQLGVLRSERGVELTVYLDI